MVRKKIYKKKDKRDSKEIGSDDFCLLFDILLSLMVVRLLQNISRGQPN